MRLPRERTQRCTVESRRRFLRGMLGAPLVGLGSSAANALFSTIVDGMSQKAWAAELGVQPRNLIIFNMAGGPELLTVTPLRPYAGQSATFNQSLNPFVGSQFKRNPLTGRYDQGVEYVTQNIHGLDLPSLWAQTVPASGGGTRPLADLAQHMIALCGVLTNGGHDGAMDLDYLPPGASVSMTALPADESDRTFPALNFNSQNYNFTSRRGKTAVNVTGSNPIQTLLTPFSPQGGTQFQASKTSLRAALQSISGLLDARARAGDIGAEAVMSSTSSALSLMEMNFGALGTVWTGLQTKYATIITRSMTEALTNPIAGFTDAPIGEGGTASNPLLYQVDGADQGLATSTDLRNTISASATVSGLASSCAFAEYVLVNGLTSSISLNIGNTGGWLRQGAAGTFGMGHDQHTSGVYARTLFNMLEFRAVLACLGELAQALDDVALWDKTVFCLGGEFGRDTNPNGSGSDHGNRGRDKLLFSGAFASPCALGNRTNDSRGSWGAGGAIPALGRQLSLVDCMVTMAHLLGVPTPFTSANPVLTLNAQGQPVPNIPTMTWV